jgi:hypothetical protein
MQDINTQSNVGWISAQQNPPQPARQTIDTSKIFTIGNPIRGHRNVPDLHRRHAQQPTLVAAGPKLTSKAPKFKYFCVNLSNLRISTEKVYIIFL